MCVRACVCARINVIRRGKVFFISYFSLPFCTAHDIKMRVCVCLYIIIREERYIRCEFVCGARPQRGGGKEEAKSALSGRGKKIYRFIRSYTKVYVHYIHIYI